MVNIPYVDTIDRTKKATEDTKFRTTEIDWTKISVDDLLWPDSIEDEFFIDDHTMNNTNNKLEEIDYNNFENLIDIIEEKYNINIIINENQKELSLKDDKNKLIWEVKIAKYKDWDFKRDIHLYNVIEDEFKWKWYGSLMFGLYIELTKHNSNFILPEEEYTNIASMVNLYKKFWYIPKYKIIFWFDVKIDLDENDFKEMEEIISNYKKWYQEQKLWYTVILEKV